MLAEDVFVAFMNEMCEWESYAIKIGLSDNIKEHQGIVAKIFEKYCTVRSRKTGKPNILSASAISNYDLVTQPIYNIEVGLKKTIIYTKQTNKAENNFKYVLVFKENKWLIDKKEISYDEGEHWERAIL
ncbi:NTF2 fold immunity protein [Pasteurella sp. PK-2025]|uniref:NTF2 fold immunity protein n=1 Tax=Pasteurella sp. PK-2025 TaxID=3413133 RepID=UPI003C735FB8